MPQSRHVPFVLDTDTDPSKLPANNARALVNVFLEQQFATGCFGNRPIAYDLPDAGNTTCVGAVWDAEAQAAYYLLFNTDQDLRIVRYRPSAGVADTVLAWSGLGIPSAPGVAQPCVTDGFLLYLDAQGEVRNIPVARALSGFYTTSLLTAEPYCLHLLKVQPLTPAVARLSTLPAGKLNSVRGAAWQFAIQDRYLDGEESLLSSYSDVFDLTNSTAEQTTQGLRVTLPQPCPALVRERVVWVRKDAETTWLALAAVPPATLTVDFFGARTGEALDEATAARVSEALWPARALGLARNRAFVGGPTEGYPVPTVSLTAQVVNRTSAADAATLTVNRTELVYYINEEIQNQDGTVDEGVSEGRVESYYASSSADPQVYYEVRPIGTSQLNFSVVPGAVPGGPDVLTDITPPFTDERPGRTFTVTPIPDANVTGFPAPGSSAAVGVERTLHERSEYQVAVQFYDALGRPGSATTPLSLQVPAQEATKQGRVVTWQLPTLAASEIPTWARYYCVLLSTNRTATSFIQGKATDVRAFRGLGTNSAPMLAQQNAAHELLYVNIKTWPRENQGYTWKAGSGDVVRFEGQTDAYPITGQSGEYLLVETRGVAPSDTPVVEVFTPRLLGSAAGSLLYERTPLYRVLNPGMATRAYAVTAGTLEGDAYLVTRAYDDNGTVTSTVEATSPSAGLRPLWLDVARGGRPAVVLPQAAQQTTLPTALRFSNPRIAGTQTNGLASWEPGNIEDSRIPRELGPLRALKSADDTQAQGNVLVGVCEHGAVSIGLSTAQIRQQDGSPLNVDTDKVIGYVNVLSGGYGTQDPQTVAAYGGKLWAYDRQRLVWWRYAQNGVIDLGQQFNFRQRLAALGAAPLPGAGYDPLREEAYLLTGEAALVMDERNKVSADTRTLNGECALGTPLGLLSWQNGSLWQHDAQAPACSFFGEYLPPVITTVFAESSNLAKRWKAVSIESPVLWRPTGLITDTGGQSTTLAPWFERREGVWRAALRGNQLTPGFTDYTRALYEGRPLDGTTLTVNYSPPEGDEMQPLSAVSVSWEPRAGQTAGIS
ncbi:hypothetical protein [Hymenobacter glacieicola]|uniref:Crassvirus muzzle protein C-terminal domain-containing protein n=1 Tax=Hymenobacter glacieicola TaxID=1562124 RepID=A0ABQ1X5T0_9BACT|nr:hypothetical protein [Hymenobacter glacieicola]GGG61334.1 hypothetical protein GCM10011378_41710 [Hymenobacter glacieicola]